MPAKKSLQLKRKKSGLKKTGKRNSQSKPSPIKYVKMVGGAWAHCDKATTLGAGVFGVAYKCVQDGNPVAVLKESQEGSNYHSAMANIDIINEKAILSKLDHPNIVHYLTQTEQDRLGLKPKNKGFYIEFCNGGDLFDKLKSVGMKNKINLNIFIQLFAGLHYLYENYIIHSDIKPENILLVESNNKITYKFADFGKAIDTNSKTIITAYDLNTGFTPGYCPTYLYFSTYFRDLYALFCVIYFVITKRFYNPKSDSVNVKKIQDHDLNDNNYGTPNIKKFVTNLIALEQKLISQEIYSLSDEQIANTFTTQGSSSQSSSSQGYMEGYFAAESVPPGYLVANANSGKNNSSANQNGGSEEKTIYYYNNADYNARNDLLINKNDDHKLYRQFYLETKIGIF